MKSAFRRLLVILSILAMFSLACGIGGKKEPTKTPRPTIVRATKTLKPPTDAPVPPTNTTAPTSTPVPPTNTPAATATLVPDLSLDKENRCEACGFSFRSITGYSLEVQANTVTMLEEGADPDLGPVVMLFGGPPDPSITAEIFLESIKSDDVEVSEPTDILVGGLNGTTAFVTGTENREEMAGQVVIIITSEQMFVALGGSPKEQWQREGSARFNAVLGSITFFTPIAVVEPTVAPVTGEQAEIRQWAVYALASSWYGTGTNWSPTQATGAPNVDSCADDASAWASLGSGTVEWLELTYATPVNPTQVNIVQNYNPSYVVKVELLDTNGNYHEVYSGNGAEADTCPFTLSIPIETVGYQALGVKITIDQSTLKDWNEIDAVELVGMGTASAASTETPGQVGAVAPTPEGFVTPAGFLWRVGGKTALEETGFTTLEGMDTDANNLIYIADGLQGIWVFNAEGEKVNVIDDPDMSQPSDVKIGPDGNIYVAAWGSNSVYVFTPDGTLVVNFGEEGKGNGQFGSFSPQELAVGPDGRIYVYDVNENDAGEDVYRIQVFNSQGKWLSSFPLVSEWDTPDGLSFGPDGNLYTVGFLSDSIVQYDPNGKLLNEMEIADGLGGPQSLDIDSAGNFYIASWDKGVVKLDPQGNLLGQWGVWAGDQAGEMDWIEGTFYRPAGVAVLSDGSRVFFCEWSNIFAYLIAFQFK